MTMHARSRLAGLDPNLRAAAEHAATALRAGTLSFGQVLGLNQAELAALAGAAHAHRRQGRLAAAAAIHALLVACDPLRQSHWRALAGLQQRQGNHALAVACFEAAAALGPRDRELTDGEALSLRELGETGLADELSTAVAQHASPES
jgi:tetratricopeptide (TPR) repeat protein